MKVLLLCYRGNPYCGGQGVYLFHLCRELSRRGVEVDVIVGPPYPDPLEQWAAVYKVENLNLWSERTMRMPSAKLGRIFSFWNFTDYLLTRFHIFPEMETFSIRAFFMIRHLLKRKRYDIIHDINSLGWGLLPMKGYGIPVISTIHHPLTRDMHADLSLDFTFWDKYTTLLFYPIAMQRFVSKRLDRILTSFREGVDELVHAFGVRRNRVSVVYNGMDSELFRNTGEPREENTLLFVGNTEDHKKGLIYLLEAMTMLPEHITLTIVDEGPPRRLTASKLIGRYRLGHRVSFTGKVDYRTLVGLYSRKTILVMSSLFEGFGLPAAEAMACETPVVATTAGALKEVVHENAGILVPPGDPEALRDALLRLLGDPDMRSQMGKFGRQWVEKNFTWPIAAGNTLEVYRDVINEFGGSS